MKTELKAELLHKRGYFTDSKNGRVSDKWFSALMLVDCESEKTVIEIEIWQGRGNDNYYCTTKLDFGEFYLQGNARGQYVNDAVRSSFKQMGITWSPNPDEPNNTLMQTEEVEKVFEAIAREIGVKRPKTIRAGYQPIYRI